MVTSLYQKTPEKWYCVRTQRKREHIAAAHLRERTGFPVFCPRISKIKATKQGKQRYIEALFPSYLFVFFDLENDYRIVNYSIGVLGVVRQGRRIPDIPGEVIRGLQLAMDGELVFEQEVSIDRGTEISIIEGPFKNFLATVCRVEKADNRIALLLNFLGREMEVCVPRESVMAHHRAPAALESNLVLSD